MIERSVIKQLLQDVGLKMTWVEAQNTTDYSDQLYEHLQDLCLRLGLSRAHELQTLLEDTNGSRPYQYTLYEEDHPEHGTKYVLMPLDYPFAKIFIAAGMVFEDASEMDASVESLIYAAHQALMSRSDWITGPQDFQGHWTQGPIFSLHLGDLYALRIAQYNESLPLEMIPPKARQEDMPAGVYH